MFCGIVDAAGAVHALSNSAIRGVALPAFITGATHCSLERPSPLLPIARVRTAWSA